MSVDVFALTNDIYIWIFCVHYTFASLFFPPLHSFIWYGRRCLYRNWLLVFIFFFFKYLRLFDLISVQQFFLNFFVLSSAFTGDSLAACVCRDRVLFARFKWKLHSTCQRRSSKPKKNRYNTSGHIVPFLIDFSCFIDFFYRARWLLSGKECVRTRCEKRKTLVCRLYRINLKSLKLLSFFLFLSSFSFGYPIRYVCTLVANSWYLHYKPTCNPSKCTLWIYLNFLSSWHKTPLR